MSSGHNAFLNSIISLAEGPAGLRKTISQKEFHTSPAVVPAIKAHRYRLEKNRRDLGIAGSSRSLKNAKGGLS